MRGLDPVLPDGWPYHGASGCVVLCGGALFGVIFVMDQGVGLNLRCTWV